LPPAVDAFFERALAKRPADRFADAATLSSALRQALAEAAAEPEAAPTTTAQRHAKGVNLIELVKLLRVARREGRLGELSAEDEALLEERILVSSWYPIERFWRVLALAHERVLGGSDEQTIELGRVGAGRVVASGVHSAFVARHDLERGLRSFERGWSMYFDFGSVEIALDGNVVRIVIRGYSDIPRAHALTTLGWYEATLGLVGARVRSARIASEPWAGGNEVVFEYELEPQG
jgi:hypothetical protein